MQRKKIKFLGHPQNFVLSLEDLYNVELQDQHSHIVQTINLNNYRPINFVFIIQLTVVYVCFLSTVI